jgi:hypothetical protein
MKNCCPIKDVSSLHECCSALWRIALDIESSSILTVPSSNTALRSLRRDGVRVGGTTWRGIGGVAAYSPGPEVEDGIPHWPLQPQHLLMHPILMWPRQRWIGGQPRACQHVPFQPNELQLLSCASIIRASCADCSTIGGPTMPRSWVGQLPPSSDGTTSRGLWRWELLYTA